jgi:hypothetical protein
MKEQSPIVGCQRPIKYSSDQRGEVLIGIFGSRTGLLLQSCLDLYFGGERAVHRAAVGDLQQALFLA